MDVQNRGPSKVHPYKEIPCGYKKNGKETLVTAIE